MPQFYLPGGIFQEVPLPSPNEFRVSSLATEFPQYETQRVPRWGRLRACIEMAVKDTPLLNDSKHRHARRVQPRPEGGRKGRDRLEGAPANGDTDANAQSVYGFVSWQRRPVGQERAPANGDSDADESAPLTTGFLHGVCTPTRCEERSKPPNGDSTRNEPRRPGRVPLRSSERNDPPSSDHVSNGSLRQVL
ncbi:hypothetical protein NPIL_92941 [Nephila pilipes]|uniref:Uncharacterized protein n=1 Tax=Nephila pilipes TaxID=299642 RepID=A0A8X6M976_NEPPI|nr:hypothetical protein NPIL_92941 [Nephila pilipes]